MGKGDSKTGQSWSNRYLVMRHGHSEANGQGIIVSTPEIGCSRYGLTGRGREQVATTLEGWSLPKPDRIFSSDFLRAKQTAEAAAAFFSAPLELSAALRERSFGELEGLGDQHYADVWRQDEQNADHQQWGVESTTAVARRVLGLIAELEQRYQQQTLLLVAHGDTLQISCTWAAGVSTALHRHQSHLQTAEARWLLAPQAQATVVEGSHHG
ncbi:histidine phosphatase family protein [Pokkaliibacter plantistimulans]|uniref:Histidine phosphatase family protein n=1 Tax=Proteobacteria bacterium 228 TaxID=2083153 RepID=A0A2S5KR29_9PROT|nr:histidine phosphatase family protein [Pokkaliibacter plantistimulans]PPC77317.1 histidine phosphatase family protein [Pokkaliibacter plantistimulans]